MKVTSYLPILNGLFTLFCTPQNVIAAVSAGELKALTDIYSTMGGVGWKNVTNWGSGDPCSQGWAGVVCTGTSVTSLNSDDNGLTGSFPNSFSGLQNLTKLSASGNSITGNLKSFLSILPTSVKYL